MKQRFSSVLVLKQREDPCMSVLQCQNKFHKIIHCIRLEQESVYKYDIGGHDLVLGSNSELLVMTQVNIIIVFCGIVCYGAKVED